MQKDSRAAGTVPKHASLSLLATTALKDRKGGLLGLSCYKDFGQGVGRFWYVNEFKYTAGLNHVGSYQVSGIPFATGNLTIPASGSTPQVGFLTLRNGFQCKRQHQTHSHGFSEEGVKNGGFNYVLIHEDTHPTFNMYNLKLSEIYFI